MKISNSEKYEYYVYEHIIDGNVFYVGKGKGNRAQDKKARSVYWRAFVGERLDEIEIVIRGYFIEEVDALTFEFMLINKYIDEGILLTNLNHNDKAVDLINDFGEEASEILKKDAKKRLELIRRRELKLKGKLAFLNGSDEFKPIVIRENYLNKKLTAEVKRFLCEELCLLDDKGRIKKWPTIRMYLEDSGYVIEDGFKQIDGKKTRVSVISLKK